jgi:hypothetical protein
MEESVGRQGGRSTKHAFSNIGLVMQEIKGDNANAAENTHSLN